VDLGITDAICLAVAVFPKNFELLDQSAYKKEQHGVLLSECLRQQ
jgi:hypothetical protein